MLAAPYLLFGGFVWLIYRKVRRARQLQERAAADPPGSEEDGGQAEPVGSNAGWEGQRSDGDAELCEPPAQVPHPSGVES